MRKVISLLMLFVVLGLSIPSQAQFQAPSPNLVVSPSSVNAVATCTTTCPTFIIPAGMCSATVRLTGTNSALSIVAQASQDAGTTYSPIAVGVVGAGITGNPGTLTTSIITANGLYYFNVPTMTRVRFIINTLTGTNVSFKPVFTSACLAVAP